MKVEGEVELDLFAHKIITDLHDNYKRLTLQNCNFSIKSNITFLPRLIRTMSGKEYD